MDQAAAVLRKLGLSDKKKRAIRARIRYWEQRKGLTHYDAVCKALEGICDEPTLADLLSSMIPLTEKVEKVEKNVNDYSEVRKRVENLPNDFGEVRKGQEKVERVERVEKRVENSFVDDRSGLVNTDKKVEENTNDSEGLKKMVEGFSNDFGEVRKGQEKVERVERVESLNVPKLEKVESFSGEVRKGQAEKAEKAEKAESLNVPKLEGVRLTWWRLLLITTSSPKLLFPMIFAGAVISLLVALQYDIYKNKLTYGFQVAVILEIGLGLLGMYKSNWLRNLAIFLLFTYTLGSQAWVIIDDANTKVANIIISDPLRTLAMKELEASIMAKKNAAKFGDHKGVKRETKTIERIKAQLAAAPRYTNKSVWLIEIQAWGLIALRCVLMVLVLFVTHRLKVDLMMYHAK